MKNVEIEVNLRLGQIAFNFLQPDEIIEIYFESLTHPYFASVIYTRQSVCYWPFTVQRDK